MLPALSRAIDLLERIAVALERIAHAQETRTQTQTGSGQEGIGQEANGSIRVRDHAEAGLEAEPQAAIA